MSYYDKVYAWVEKIPYGKVATYGQLALLTGSPRAARAVGYALRAAKDPKLPCHRVLRADGSVTCGFPPGLQRAMLESEGVTFTEEGLADLALARWDGG